MREEYPKRYSNILGRDMECGVFRADAPADIDHSKVCLVFPPQAGRFYDFKNFGMIECLRPWIESGQLFVICVDGIDGETWSASGDPRARIEKQELWFHYVVDELLPEYTSDGEKAMVTGCSMGGFHSANFFLRRPDLFDGMVALSGVYNAQFFFHEYMDNLVYDNSPLHFLPNMPVHHPWIDLYKQSEIIMCVGQGAWEDEMLYDTRELDRIMNEKGIPHWADYWGYDVNHDWPWWQKQLPYFIDHLARKGYL